MNLAIWEHRWSILQATIDATARMLPSMLDRQALLCILQNLAVFGQAQFHFFYDKLLAREAAPESLTQEDALARTLDQIAHDLDAISKAAYQRIAGSPEMLNTLEQTDELAERALKPAIEAEYLAADTNALTYFHRSPFIRYMPYATTALIGIPFTCIQLIDASIQGAAFTTDLLTIPVEAGRFVYWHGRSPDEADSIRMGQGGVRFVHALPERLASMRIASAGIVDDLQRTAESAFAEVYARCVVGPAMALCRPDQPAVTHRRAEDEVGAFADSIHLRPQLDWLGRPFAELSASRIASATSAEEAEALCGDLNQALRDFLARGEMRRPGNLPCRDFDWLAWKERLMEDETRSPSGATRAGLSPADREWLAVLGAGGWVATNPSTQMPTR
jgi:hypothetical protein